MNDIEKYKQLIEQGLSTHGIAKELNMSQTNARYYLKKYGLTTNKTVIPNLEIKCINCNCILKGKQRMYCSLKCKHNNWYHTNKNTPFINFAWKQTQSRGLVFKIKLINDNNGCSICNYSKNVAALSLHHLNPYEKSFNLSLRKLGSVNHKLIKSELDKCQLLCSNCHFEIESPNLEINEYSKVKHFSTATGLKRKIKLLEYSGCFCKSCGYSKNYRSLSFHHKNPDDKKFNLNIYDCQKRQLDELFIEANKCIVLCGNCHMEKHYPHLNLKIGLAGIEPATFRL